MAIQQINLGSQPKGVGGNNSREAGEKINANFEDLDERVASAKSVADSKTTNATDAHLLNRPNHTGTQSISTILGLQVALDSAASQIDITGNAATAGKLKTPVQINGVPFDGSQSINIVMPGGGAGGSTSYADTAGKLANPVKIHGVNFDGGAGFDIPNFTATKSGVVPAAGSNTTKYLRSDGTWVIPTDTQYTVMTATAANLGIATTANTISAKVLKDAIQYHAPTVTNIAGNAETATKLQTARTISLTGGVTGSINFDGSSDVSITTTINGTSGTPGGGGSNVDNSGLIILIKDSLRQSVEVASGGEQTVLYTAKGQPTYMNIIQKYDMRTINPSLSGTHPAFIVDGVEKPEIFIGTYQGKIVSGELLSLPNVEPTHSTDYDNFLNAARANGNGHHLITNAEWSAVALQCYKNNTQPMGNSYYGRSPEDPLLIGRRADGLNPGDTSGSARTLTGSGPVQWRHNGKNNGIADLSGNVWEWNSGMRLLNGEIQIIENNNAAKLAINLGTASTEWKAIDGATGNLVTPNGSGTTPGTVKFATSGTADYTIKGSTFGAIKNLSTTKPVSTAALSKLQALCLFPHIDAAATFNGDGLYFSLTVEAQPLRGGPWSYGAATGVFSLRMDSARSLVYANIGSRPAFVNL